MSRVEEVVERLAEIQDQMAGLPEGPSAEKFDLLTERDSLRAEAHRFAVDADLEKTTESLESELASLRSRRKQIVASRTGYVTGKGGGNASPVDPSWVKLASQSMSASGVDSINARISHIEDVLAARSRAADE